VDSFPGRTFRGTVGQVRKAALVVQNVVTYTAVISTSNPNLELFPGMTANVRIVVDTRENALKLPNAALRFRPTGAADSREPGAAAAEEESKKGGGQQAGPAVRERLTKELQLDAGQQAKLEAILNETRDRISAIATEDKGERRKQSERLRADSRTRIAEILNPEQRKRYEEMTPGRAGGGGRVVTSGRIWMLDDSGKPKAVNVRIGLADGTYSELVSGELKEGTQVIVGTQADAKGRAQQTKGGPRFGF
jgi:HlyD family secretion protein